MADISGLQNLQAGEPLDWDQYPDAQEAPNPPGKGRYIVQAPSSFTFGSTKAGFLSAQIDPVIVGPSEAGKGYVCRFTKISAKPFNRGKLKVSQLGDYLRATLGAAAPRPSSPQEQAEAVEQTANRTYQIDGDVEAYCKGCQRTIAKGEAAVRARAGQADGPVPAWVPCDQCKDEHGDPQNARVNFKVDRFIAAN